MRGFLPPLLIGAAAGFLALFMRELGLVLSAVVVVSLAVTYVGRRRFRSIGWLLMGAAAPWLILLGPIAFAGLVDREASATVPETYLGVVAAVFIAGFAVVMLVIFRSDDEGRAVHPMQRSPEPDPRVGDGDR